MRSKRNENLKYCNKIRTKIARGKIGREKEREGRKLAKTYRAKTHPRTREDMILIRQSRMKSIRINKEIQNTFIDKQINTGMGKGENRAELNNTLARIHTKQQAPKLQMGPQQRQVM